MSRDPTNPFAPLDNAGWLDSRNPARDHSGSFPDAGPTNAPSGMIDDPTKPFAPHEGCEMKRTCRDSRFCVGHCVPAATPSPASEEWDRAPEKIADDLANHGIAPASEVGEMVERLGEEASRLETRAYGDRCVSPDCALASNLAGQAADLLARVAAERREYADSAAYWKVAHDRVAAERDKWNDMHTRECEMRDRYRIKLEAAEAALEKAREALAEASDGLRYWEPQTDKGWRERARITSLVDAALAAMEARDGN